MSLEAVTYDVRPIHRNPNARATWRDTSPRREPEGCRMATLIDSLTNLVTPAVGQIAAKLGESETAVSTGVTGSLGAMLGGLLHKSTDTAAFAQIFDVIGSAPPSANLDGDLQTAVGAIG